MLINVQTCGVGAWEFLGVRSGARDHFGLGFLRARPQV